MAAHAPPTPPPLHGAPTTKEKRYDRQLRLWAASGQAALEDAHVLLVNAAPGPGAVGVEALKNLILPGIGRFSVLDSALVSAADLGVNFFLDDACLGGPRAEHTVRLLQELNPDVHGHAITEPAASFVARPGALAPFTLILVVAPLHRDLLDAFSAHARTHAVPLFLVHCTGFYSHFALSLPPAFPIVDTHPDPASTTDLRLLAPWPELARFAREKTADLQSLAPNDLGHVPYLLLLLHFLDRWRASHDGQVPQSYREKTEFREIVRDASPANEENFDEAVAAVLKSLNPPTPSSSVLAVLDAPEAQHLTPASASFWYIANAIHRFYKTHAQLPLPGAVPDMKARSADYIRLQNIYKSKARQDSAEVLSTVRSLEKQIGRPAAIDEKEVEAFCKGAAHVKLVRGKPLRIAQPHQRPHFGPDAAKSAVNALQTPDSGVLLYIAFLAWDTFASSHDADDQGTGPRVPGLRDQDLEADTQKVVGIAETIIDQVIAEAGSFIENPEYDEIKAESAKVVRELVRAGDTELHNMAALTGGMVAQEVIKVITRQYVPIDNTCVFDGVQSKAAVLRL